MNAKLLIQKTIEQLQQRKANLCCEEVKDLLGSLGFDVRDGKQGGHKIFTHLGLPSFMSGSFNCGHGKNPEIKPAYIGKIIQVLRQYHDELEAYLEKTS
jgi:hypothetical protein